MKHRSLRRIAKSCVQFGCTYVLPEAPAYRLLTAYHAKTPRTALDTATDHRTYEAAPEVQLVVYWTDGHFGSGPSASLFVLENEVLRLDCLGADRGHYHINPRQVNFMADRTVQLLFQPGSYEDHIRRAAFELRANTSTAIKMNRDPRVRRFTLGQTELERSAEYLQEQMFELLSKHAQN